MAAIAAPTLSRSERHAVSIALADAASRPCASGRKPGVLARLYALVTGNAPARPLADPRLETIRRFVCASRVRPAAAERLMPELAAQGFSPAQVDALAMLSR